MTIQEYRLAEGVAQSQLKHLARSPAHFKWALDHPQKTTDAMAFGSLCDSLLFGTEFKWAESPYDDFRKTEAKEWREFQLSIGFWPFKREVVQNARDLVESILRRQTAKRIFGSGDAQVPLFAELCGVKCKGLADWVCSESAIICDLKTTGKPAASTIILGDDEEPGLASDEEWGKIVTNMGYDVQAAFYVDLFAAATGETMDFWWIAAESDPPFEVAFFVATGPMLERGRRIYKQRLALYRQCLESGEWPGYPDRPQFVNPPGWAK